MADNVAITPGVGATVATDDVGGVQYQRVKLDIGGDGVTSPVLTANPLPVTLPGTAAATPFPIVAGLKTTNQYSQAAITCNTIGNNIIIAASVGNKFRIYGLMFTVATPVDITLTDTVAPFSGAMSFGLGGGLCLLPMGEPYFVGSATNKPFDLTLSVGVQVSGVVWYTLAP